MKAYRPKRITIRLTEEEHQALSELRSKRGGSYQAVVFAALEREYRLADYAASIREHNRQHISYLLSRGQTDQTACADQLDLRSDPLDPRQPSDIPV